MNELTNVDQKILRTLVLNRLCNGHWCNKIGKLNV